MCAAGMGREQTHRLGGIGVDNRPATTGDARVVDQDVNPSEVGDDRVHHRAVLFVVVDGGLVGFRPPAHRRDRRHGGVRLGRLAPIVHRDVHSVLGKAKGDGPADTPACARNQRHPRIT